MTRTIYIISGITILVILALPNNGHWLIPCPFYKVTGWQCPFCGGQRMISMILHGEWSAAFTLNPFLFCSLPMFILWILQYLLPDSASVSIRKFFTDKFYLFYLLSALLWGFIRNLYL